MVALQARLEAQQDVLNFMILCYSSYRVHLYLGYVSPNPYEAEMAKLKLKKAA